MLCSDRLSQSSDAKIEGAESVQLSGCNKRTCSNRVTEYNCSTGYKGLYCSPRLSKDQVIISEDLFRIRQRITRIYPDHIELDPCLSACLFHYIQICPFACLIAEDQSALRL